MAKSVQFIAVKTAEDVSAMCSLAEEIWREHFTPIIGKEQVAYMLTKFQSPRAVAEQIQIGYEYYFSQVEGKNIGYIGIHRENEALFLSKLYVHKSERGKGYARCAIQFLIDICRQDGLKKIWLTVNKFNADTIAIYKKMGFVITREQKADIGSGFFMDDYIMEKPVE